MKQLILTVTRQCNLRCSYCPTAKDGWPSLTAEDATEAIRLFSTLQGGGTVKIFGGEPLLVPDVVRAALEEARHNPTIRWVYLSTNGLGLDDAWLDYLEKYPKVILTISMDGKPEDHRRHRRAVSNEIPDTYDHVLSLTPRLTRMQRVVLTQTIAPATAYRASENFHHLLELGYWRFNFLPGYYIPWKRQQLEALESNFAEMHDTIVGRWEEMQRTYIRNLFTWAPTPFFNTGMVVDADRTIHPSNVGLSGTLDHLREKTLIGTLDSPPTPDEIEAGARRVNGLLESALSQKVWNSTNLVDHSLSTFCKGLYPHWVQYKRRRDAA